MTMGNKQSRGKLIAIIGIDGSGKSTIVNKLADTSIVANTIATSCSHNPVLSHEMYCACKNWGESSSTCFSDEFKHFLYMGSCILTAYNDVVPLLEKGINVVLDRYSICLKLFSKLYTKPTHHCLANILDCLPKPDLGIYLDIEVEESLKRIKMSGRSQKFSLHESKEDLISKKREYEYLIPLENYRVVKINANRSHEDVFSDVISEISNLIICN
jgi:thymidylate kinase